MPHLNATGIVLVATDDGGVAIETGGWFEGDGDIASVGDMLNYRRATVHMLHHPTAFKHQHQRQQLLHRGWGRRMLLSRKQQTT